MKLTRLTHSPRVLLTALVAAAVVLLPMAPAGAEGSAPGVVFQRPNRGGGPATTSTGGVKFRSAQTPAVAAAPVAAQPIVAAPQLAAPTAADNPLRTTTAPRVVATAATRPAVAPAAAVIEPTVHVAARPLATAPRPNAMPAPENTTAIPSFAQPGQNLSGTGMAAPRSRTVAAASIEPWIEEEPSLGPSVRQASFGAHSCDCGEPTCGICEAACGVAEPACGCAEPGCGICEADCGIVEPGCGLEAGCGMEPDCGIVDCGNCVGNPGPDFWCFPVCLPRFKDLRFWAGVHGFKGPRDSPLFGGAGDGNFGFQEGFNIGGRAPLISLIFPQLAYQFGFQAVQSQLSGLSDNTISDRSQEFITAGIFRRVRSGVQFGVAYDWMQDDFQTREDFSQLRYEISLKGQRGLEFGFWGASHLSDATVEGITYQSVDQYNGFVRWQFREGGSMRFWGGATNDSEGIFGADFIAPLNNRWSVNSGFNYLITDAANGEVAAREESWNVGINLVWHYGLVAKKGNSNPYAPLFQTADNGWMFIDQTP